MLTLVQSSSGSSLSCRRADTGHEQGRGLFFHGDLRDGDRVWQHFDGASQVERANNDQATFRAPFQQGACQGNEHRESEALTAPIVVHRAHLNGKLVPTPVAIADERLALRVEILFPHLDAFAETRRCRRIQDFHAPTRTNRDLDAIQAGTRFPASGADGPDLAWRKGIAVDGLIAVKFRRRDELLNAVNAHRVAEVRVPEFTLETSLLLFLDAASGFECEPNDRLEVVVGDLNRRIGEQQFQEATDGLV